VCPPHHEASQPIHQQPLVVNLFSNLFTAPTCTFVIDHHLHQYTVIYDRGEKFWVLQEEFIARNFLHNIPRIPNLKTHPISFVTPFHTDVFHNIWVNASAILPPINLCTKIRRHPHSVSFSFSYLELSFVDSIKFLFGQFPPDWLEYFEGVLIPLVAFDFLDRCITTLCGHLHFTPDSICHRLPLFLPNSFFPFSYLTPDHLPHAYITYLWTVLAFSRDFHMIP